MIGHNRVAALWISHIAPRDVVGIERPVVVESRVRAIYVALCVVPFLTARMHAQMPLSDTGPHFVISAALAEIVEYRDVMLDTELSSSFNAGATFRGVSLSAWKTFSPRGRAHEIALTYSQRLPLATAHVGAVTCDVFGRLSACASGVQLTLESATLPRLNIGVTTVQPLVRDAQRSWTVFGTGYLFESEGLRVALRFSASDWNGPESKASGATGRLVIDHKLAHGVALHAFLGGIISCVRSDVTSGRAQAVCPRFDRLVSPLGAFTLAWVF